MDERIIFFEWGFKRFPQLTEYTGEKIKEF